MTEKKFSCPECESTEPVDRRAFLSAVGGTAVTLVGLEALPLASRAKADGPAAVRAPRPAEDLIRELYASLSDAQKSRVVLPWNHGVNPQGGGTPTRLRFFNAAIFSDRKIEDVYTPAQTELCERILRGICNGDEGFRLISRAGTWDNTATFGRCGAYIFGDPTGDNQFAWVFTGHHLTVRCDGNSEPDAAFGGPLYYGHSPDGWSQRNLFYPQTLAAKDLFESFNPGQRQQALVAGSPGEGEGSVRFRPRGQRFPGLAAAQMTHDQRALVERLMRSVLSPYRAEDAEEVMQLVRRNGGLEQLHVAFYRDPGSNEDARWTFWRIEGPGFVWNFRVLPHVHTYVNIGIPRPNA
ncbi:MAG: DUF3500 domain-containing protein [Gemmataceae bacterium]|nr:DUF3500 domain-containing protein [Gemmataceae bacterium]